MNKESVTTLVILLAALLAVVRAGADECRDCCNPSCCRNQATPCCCPKLNCFPDGRISGSSVLSNGFVEDEEYESVLNSDPILLGEDIFPETVCTADCERFHIVRPDGERRRICEGCKQPLVKHQLTFSDKEGNNQRCADLDLFYTINPENYYQYFAPLYKQCTSSENGCKCSAGPDEILESLKQHFVEESKE